MFPLADLLMSSPMPVMMPRMRIQATASPAATRPWRVRPAGSGWAGCRSRASFWLQALGHRMTLGLAGRPSRKLERERGQAEPGDPDCPAADDIGDVVHAEQRPADPDHGNEDRGHGREPDAPPAAGRWQEDQEHGAIADDRAERVPTGEAVAGGVGDGVGEHGAKPANQHLQHRIEDERACPGDDEIGSQPPAAAQREQQRSRGDHDGHDHRAAEQRDALDHREGRGVAGDEVVEPVGRAAIERLKRAPPEPDQDEQDREDDRGGGDQDH